MGNDQRRFTPRVRLAIRSEEGEVFFGIGIAELLRRIDETGSIRKASFDMEMSYSKCWKIIRRAEKNLGFALLDGNAGGSHGGGSRLTDEGRDYLDRFFKAQQDLKAYTEEVYQKYFSD